MESSTYHHGDLKNALIKAGVEILANEGLSGLSLRKVAKQAGVSHAAPYSHFTDKQALIAAISTEGFRQLHTQLEEVATTHQELPESLLIETAWTYLQFALNNPDRFKLMFSSVLEKEKDYPDFVDASQDNFRELVSVVEICQQAGILKPGPADLVAVVVWGAVHGLLMLILEGQIPRAVLNEYNLRELVLHSLNQVTLTKLTEST
jgi:AcrR family transcriptional regulator